MARLAVLLLACFALAIPARSQARNHYSGNCEQGGKTVATQGMTSSTKVQQSFPSCTVTVYITGGAVGYVNTSGTAVTWASGNTFNANSSGWNGASIVINSVTYAISSCATVVACTLTSSAGVQTGVAYSIASAKAPLYSDASGTVKANPFTAASTGAYGFYFDASFIDVTLSGGGIASPFTLSSQIGTDPLSLARTVSDRNYIGYTFAQACAAAVLIGAQLGISEQWKNVPTQACPANLVGYPGGSIQPASSAVFTPTATLATPAISFFDYSSGGTVDLSKARYPLAYPEWIGGLPDGSTNSTTAFTRLITAIGKGRTIKVSAGTGCYLISAIILQRGQNMIGDGYSTATDVGSCVQSTGAASIMVMIGVGSELSGFKIDGLNAATYGVQIAGENASESADATYNVIHHMDIRDAVTALIGTSNAFENTISNNILNGNGHSLYGVRTLSSNVNGQLHITDNEIRNTVTAAILVDSTDGLRAQGNVIESSAGDGVKFEAGSIANISTVIEKNHFELEGTGGAGHCDINAPYGGSYNSLITYNLDIHGNYFVQSGGSQIACLSSVGGLKFQDNYTAIPVTSATAALRTVKVGKGTWVQENGVSGNTGVIVTDDAGNTLSPSSGASVKENLVSLSSQLSTTWSLSAVVYSGSQVGAAAIDQVGAPALADGTPAWRITLPTPSGGNGCGANCVAVRLNIAAEAAGASAGVLLGGCFSAYTDAGTVGVSLILGGYTGGSALYTQQAVLGTRETRICMNVMKDSADSAAPTVGAAFWALSGSPVYVYIGKYHFFTGKLAPPAFVNTTTAAIQNAGMSNPGSNIFAQLPACAAGNYGLTSEVTDSNTNTWGASIAAGGSNKVLGQCNGSAWTVTGK